jgi:PAS domain S-box-containing protein
LAAERSALLAEKEQAVEQLSASEQQYRSMVDLYDSLWQSITKQAVIVTDRDGLITEWNPGAQRMLGLSQQEAVSGERIHRFITDDISTGLIADHPELAGRRDAVGILFALADADANVDRVFDVTTATGTTLPARVTVVPFKDGGGAALGYLFVLSDETQAAEVARMKDQFVGMISHELRTPLSSIVGFVDLLQHDLDHPLTDEQLGFVAVIERNAQRLLTLVGDLLFTAQVESGRFPLDVSDTDVTAVVRAAVTSAGPHAAREGIDVVTRLPETPVRLEADAQRLGQAIDNLVSNALKFTPRGGTVTVAVDERDAQVVVSVRDTGMGIPADEQQKLFTRFFRASTATRNAVPGVGLGLTITRAIVHAHGGELQFESEEGVGTEFRMLLPVAPRTQPLLRVAAGPSSDE